MPDRNAIVSTTIRLEPPLEGAPEELLLWGLVAPNGRYRAPSCTRANGSPTR